MFIFVVELKNHRPMRTGKNTYVNNKTHLNRVNRFQSLVADLPVSPFFVGIFVCNN